MSNERNIRERRRGGDSRQTPADTGPQTRQLSTFFVPGKGIGREIITGDITFYLGTDALVKTGTYEDPRTGEVRNGYFVTAYRALTTDQLQELKKSSTLWQAEKTSSQGRRQFEWRFPKYPGHDELMKRAPFEPSQNGYLSGTAPGLGSRPNGAYPIRSEDSSGGDSSHSELRRRAPAGPSYSQIPGQIHNHYQSENLRGNEYRPQIYPPVASGIVNYPGHDELTRRRTQPAGFPYPENQLHDQDKYNQDCYDQNNNDHNDYKSTTRPENGLRPKDNHGQKTSDMRGPVHAHQVHRRRSGQAARPTQRPPEEQLEAYPGHDEFRWRTQTKVTQQQGFDACTGDQNLGSRVNDYQSLPESLVDKSKQAAGEDNNQFSDQNRLPKTSRIGDTREAAKGQNVFPVSQHHRNFEVSPKEEESSSAPATLSAPQSIGILKDNSTSATVVGQSIHRETMTLCISDVSPSTLAERNATSRPPLQGVERSSSSLEPWNVATGLTGIAIAAGGSVGAAIFAGKSSGAAERAAVAAERSNQTTSTLLSKQLMQDSSAVAPLSAPLRDPGRHLPDYGSCNKAACSPEILQQQHNSSVNSSTLTVSDVTISGSSKVHIGSVYNYCQGHSITKSSTTPSVSPSIPPDSGIVISKAASSSLAMNTDIIAPATTDQTSSREIHQSGSQKRKKSTNVNLPMESDQESASGEFRERHLNETPKPNGTQEVAPDLPEAKASSDDEIIERPFDTAVVSKIGYAIGGATILARAIGFFTTRIGAESVEKISS